MNEQCHLCDKIEDKLEKIHSSVIDNKVAIAELKVKSGLWGIIGGMVPALGIMLAWFGFLKK